MILPDNFRIEFYILISDSIIDDFSQRLDRVNAIISLGVMIYKTKTITFPLLLSESFWDTLKRGLV